MRREKRPFTVEVKRGGKRANQPSEFSTVTQDDTFQRAENALFGSPATAPPMDAISAEAPTARRMADDAPGRRILEAVEAPEPEPNISEDVPKRRGRKPGSKNKPAIAEVATPKRRGRPRKSGGSEVRSIFASVDIVNDALGKISRAAPLAPTGVTTMFVADVPGEQPIKRGRGRPRKIVPPGGFPPKVPSWIAWAESPDEPEAQAREPAPVVEARRPRAVEIDADAGPVAPIVRALERMARPTGLRAGTRWSRRLRGYALAHKRALNR